MGHDDMDVDRSSVGSDSDDQGDDIEPSQHFQSYVLAGISSKGVMTAEEILELICRAAEYYKAPLSQELTGPSAVKDLVDRINQDLRRFKLTIKRVSCEFSGKEYFVLVTEGENPVMSFQTTFKKPEVTAIESCLNKMLRSETFSLTMAECIGLVRKAVSKSSYTDGRSFISKLIEASYFTTYGGTDLDDSDEENDEVPVTLGCRSILELGTTIAEKHPNALTTCKLCYKTLLHGYNCPGCDVSVHQHCLEKYIAMSKTCPGENCNAQWSGIPSLVRRKRPGGALVVDTEDVLVNGNNIVSEPSDSD